MLFEWNGFCARPRRRGGLTAAGLRQKEELWNVYWDGIGIASMIASLSMSELTALRNPITQPPWKSVQTPITVDEIRLCVDRRQSDRWTKSPGYFYGALRSENSMRQTCKELREAHIERIADLVLARSMDPISIVMVVNENVVTTFEIVDGWHRLAAAVVRGDDRIDARFSLHRFSYFANRRLAEIDEGHILSIWPESTFQMSLKRAM